MFVVLLFPIPLVLTTLIAELCEDPTLSSSSQDVLTKVRKALVEGCNDLTVEELLEKANVDPDEYMSALAMSTKGSVVVLKCKLNECNINNYNVPIMLAWQANMDLRYVLNAYACRGL